jgi:cold-inducible RNA-binding protein
LNKKLYIGNLPYSTTSDQLKELFSEAGTVDDAVVITDRQSGRSKGFGFVEFSKEAEAKKAVESMDGREVDGRAIKVAEARPPREE